MGASALLTGFSAKIKKHAFLYRFDPSRRRQIIIMWVL